MLKRKIFLIQYVIFIPLFLLFATKLSIAQTLAVPETFQEQGNWCWAACSQAILSYYKTNVTQCTIANWTISTTHGRKI